MERGLFGLGNPFGDQAALQWVVKHSAPLGMKSGLSEVRTGSGSGVGIGIEVAVEVEAEEGSETKGREEVEAVGEEETVDGREREGANEDKEGVKGTGKGTGRGTEGGVVVYGSGLYALTAVTGLIKNKVSPQLISLILPEVELEELGHPKVNPVATLSLTHIILNRIALVTIYKLPNFFF